ncbi:Lon protease C-terminal proteolytic domain-containing protein [Flagelloscypha sp. PMI_526]|nr:Lon protease C-terminal proteolytic domain-containing protein [Flagelloscypha sp. PMI_526]
MSWLRTPVKTVMRAPHVISQRSLYTFDLGLAGFSSRYPHRNLSATSQTFARPSRTLMYSPKWLNQRPGKEDGEQEQDESSKDEETPTSDQPEEAEKEESDKSVSSSAGEPSSSETPSSTGNTPPASNNSDSPPISNAPLVTIAIQSVPEVYPRVLALPIARRPLFPGFYKSVIVRDKRVVDALSDMIKKGQPYLGAFLLKDDNSDKDVITNLDEVHPVGVFAQISTLYRTKVKNEKGELVEAMTAVLFPHRRIRITELVKAGVVSVNAEETSESTSESSSEEPIIPISEDSSIPDGLKLQGTLQTSFLNTHEISIVDVDNVVTDAANKESQVVRALMSEIVVVFKELAQLNHLIRDQIHAFSMNHISTNIFDEPEKLADFSAAMSGAGADELQEVLESTNVEDRLQKALVIVKKELINVQLQYKMAKEVEERVAKRQKEYYLMEQLKGIKKELGMEDGKDKLIEKFKERAASLKMPEVAAKMFEEEINKLQALDPAGSEANVTRNYLEWLTQIPWGQHSKENYNIKHARTVLDEDHYGLKDVKDRILEFLAVGKLRGTVEGKIICLVGPPGVGKTSIGKSISRALNRQFFRFSVGGLTDVAEIKGHRRTYVGALPGKIIQALKRVGTENPLVLIDEVDKIGRGHNGDPSSALLEMLDPEQNNSFMDHYMDVPVDLSRVLFVCTANNLETIPAPLLDRMEVLEVSGYVSDEKSEIADKYLGPQAKEASGLKNADVVLQADAIDLLIKYYCRESGVRNLKKHIEKVYRKAALKLVQDLGEDVFPEPTSTTSESSEPKTVENHEPEPAITSDSATSDSSSTTKEVTTEDRQPLQVPADVHVRITPENLKDYVGPPVYQKDRMYVHPPPAGVSTGLGYLGNGSGSVLPVEVMSMPGKGGLQLTGKLGEVIRESCQIALSWVKSNAYALGVSKSMTEQFLTELDVHVHMPEGAIGKEGPSAGTAILSAFVSLFTKTKISPDIAMTGEISLVALRRKFLAAHRAGITTILAPAANRPDIETNVPDSVKTGVRFVYVEDVRQVLHEVFRGTPIAERWKDTLPLEASYGPAATFYFNTKQHPVMMLLNSLSHPHKSHNTYQHVV